eukprot:714883_1
MEERNVLVFDLGGGIFEVKSTSGVNQRVREPDPEAPYAAISSTPTNPEPGKPVRIDATECVDYKGNPRKNFVLIWINCWNAFFPQTPFGGYKESGFGRIGGQYMVLILLQRLKLLHKCYCNTNL